jgi:DNA-binding transcriptional LysR family regulator
MKTESVWKYLLRRGLSSILFLRRATSTGPELCLMGRESYSAIYRSCRGHSTKRRCHIDRRIADRNSALRRDAFEPCVAQRTTRLSTVMCLVGSGIGLSLVPESAAMLQIKGILLRRLREPQIKIPLSIVARSNHRAPALNHFISALHDSAKSIKSSMATR